MCGVLNKAELYAFGKVIDAQAPRDAKFSSVILPPCSSMTRLEKVSPRPELRLPFNGLGKE